MGTQFECMADGDVKDWVAWPKRTHDERDLTERTASAATGEPWVDFEIETAVAAYASMLQAQVRGEPYTKAEVVSRVHALLPARSAGSIERKFQNISAVLDEVGIQWIDGYKPLLHYQYSLRRSVLDAIGPGRRLTEALAAYARSPLVAPQSSRLATDDVLVDPPRSRPGPRETSVRLTGGAVSALHDFQTRELGAAGEEWVIDLERERLQRLQRPDLSDRVSWVSHDEGDAAGYDVRSFWPDGRPRLIEVKTTNLGPRTPFYITRWEIETSKRNAPSYSLYRVHGFARDPRIYVLDGSVEDRARLEPKVFLGIPL